MEVDLLILMGWCLFWSIVAGAVQTWRQRGPP
jgi:hypothetical protein